MAQGQAQALLGAAQRDKSSLGAIYRWQRRAFQVFGVSGTIYVLMILAIVASDMLSRRNGTEFDPGFSAVIDPILLLLIPAAVAVLVFATTHTRKFFTSLWALRQSAISDDDLMAPIIPQPQPITGGEAPAISQSFVHIRWLDDPLNTRLLIVQRLLSFGLLPLYSVGFFGSILFGRAFWTALDTLSPYGYAVIFIVYCVLMFAPLFTIVFTAALHRQGVLVRTDEHGLTWRRRRFKGSERRVAWSDLRSFSQLGFLTTPSYNKSVSVVGRRLRRDGVHGHAPMRSGERNANESAGPVIIPRRSRARCSCWTPETPSWPGATSQCVACMANP